MPENLDKDVCTVPGVVDFVDILTVGHSLHLPRLTCLGILMLAALLATPEENSSILAVSWRPVRRRLLSSPCVCVCECVN